ncbi:hypothetical protein ABPG72_006828 [Tetrahymena utriculariae]
MGGILTLPYKSEIKIHTEVYQIKQYASSLFRKQKYSQTSIKGSKNSPKLMNEYIFLIGQTIDLNFEIIYPTNLYSFYLLIQFTAVKPLNVLDQSQGSRDEAPQQNMILIKTQIPLGFTSFVYNAEDQYDLAVTNSDQSAAIYNSMLSQNMLNSDGTVNDKFDYYKNLILDSDLKTSQQSYHKINRIDGKLIQKNQDSVIFQISQSNDQLKISGALENVNKVLQQKIIFDNSTALSQQDSPKITITRNDNTNFPLTLPQSIYENNFITLKNSIKLNEKLNLQFQITNQYPGVKDSKLITYQTYYLSPDGNSTQIPPSLWLQQMNSDKMNFKGTTTSAIYGKHYKFKVIATDKNTISVDFFTVEVSRIPFTYVFNLLLKILGLILAVFGIQKERFTFYYMIFRKYVKFSDEAKLCGNQYKKRIIIISNEQENAMLIFKNLIKNIIQKPKRLEENYLDRPPISINNKIYDPQKEKKTSKEIQNDFQEFSKLEKNMKQNFEFKIDSQYVMKIQKELSFTEQYDVSELERRYLNNEGGLKLSQLIEDVVDYQIIPSSYKQKSQDQYFEEISDPNSLLQRTLRALISRYLLKKDKRSQIIYQYIKNYFFQMIQKNKNGWYKAILKITYNTDQELKNKKEFILLPQLQLNYSVIIEIIKSLNMFNQQNLQQLPQTFEQFKNLIDQNNLKFNFFFIREVIFADALGFPEEKPSRFQPSAGQCIDINSYEISQIIAYKQKKIFKFLRPLNRFLNMEYTKYGFSKNMGLPSCLQFDQKNNLTLLQGTPQNCDIEEMLIKIFDKNGYAIKQFILKVVYQSQKQELKFIKGKIDQINNEIEEFQQLEESVHSKMHLQKQIYVYLLTRYFCNKNSYNQSQTLEDSTQTIFKNKTTCKLMFSPKGQQQRH